VDAIQFDKAHLQVMSPFLRMASSRALANNSRTTITAMFYYTTQFADVTTDPRAYIEGMVNSANMAYNNSNINLRLEIFCVEEYKELKESNDAPGMLEAFTKARGEKGVCSRFYQVRRSRHLV
jgi:hypothetical protein